MMSKQQDLFQAQTTWFHVFKAMIDNGDVAKMGPTATTVYLVIKAYSNMSAGYSFPSLETIAKGCGCNKRTVQRAIDILEEFKYIETVKKIGRNNVYKLREQIPVHIQGQASPFAVASFDYVPTAINEATAELRNYLLTGERDGKLIHIDRLTMHVQINQSGATGNQFNLSEKALSELDKPTRDKVVKMMMDKREKHKKDGDIDFFPDE